MTSRHGRHRRSFAALVTTLVTTLGLALAPSRPASAALTPGESVAAGASAADDRGAGEPAADEPAATTGGAASTTDPADDASAPSTSSTTAPSPVPATGPDQAPARASLTVDTSAIGSQSPVLLRRIEELGDITLRRSEILPGRSAQDPVIAIRIRTIDEGGYAIESHLVVGGQILANSERTVLCTLCTEGETVDRARVEVERLVPFVRSHAEAQAREEAARRKANARRPAPPPAPERPRVAVKTKVGAALLAVGGVSLGVGIGLAARKVRPDPDMPLQVIDTRVPGYVLAGLGGALVITGVSLLLAGRSEATERRVQVAPTARGLVISGRF